MSRVFCAAPILIGLISLFPALSAAGEGSYHTKLSQDFERLEQDYKGLYLDTGSLVRLGAGIGAAGLAANTDMDREVKDYFRNHLRNNPTDAIGKAARVPGEVFITLPAVFAVHLIVPENGAAGVWAGRSLRALLLGGPLGVFLQRVTGASRPEEGPSSWRPFKDGNGLSGHAFVGTVPFITGAMMQEGYMKVFFYGLSALPAFSRINDNAHYPSQAFLGWYLAYLSSSVVAGDKGESSGGFAFYMVPAGREGLMAWMRIIF
ncbi:MAG: hypothetical protein HZB83_06185 [Deltaproteobacteria bacterium]|nr:hypothetical protein [Deltaproteobacteria bacterium]